jgi:hypothetical protein
MATNKGGGTDSLGIPGARGRDLRPLVSRGSDSACLRCPEMEQHHHVLVHHEQGVMLEHFPSLGITNPYALRRRSGCARSK